MLLFCVFRLDFYLHSEGYPDLPSISCYWFCLLLIRFYGQKQASDCNEAVKVVDHFFSEFKFHENVFYLRSPFCWIIKAFLYDSWHSGTNFLHWNDKIWCMNLGALTFESFFMPLLCRFWNKNQKWIRCLFIFMVGTIIKNFSRWAEYYTIWLFSPITAMVLPGLPYKCQFDIYLHACCPFLRVCTPLPLDHISLYKWYFFM